MSASIQESAKRQINQVTAIAGDAVTSKAWLYPVQGLIYLLTHPTLFRPLIPVLFKGAILSLVIVGSLFLFTYLPQVAVLAFVSGPLAFIAAVPLVLGEAYVLINFVARTFLFDQVAVDLFDAVLVQKGQTALVEKGRQVQGKGGKTRVLGKLIGKPLGKLNVDSIVRYLLTLPLNFIPVVGPAFFLGYNGYKSGPGYHSRFFQLKGYDKARRVDYIKERRGAYTGFGIVATLLNLVPVVSILFTFSSTVGAALLAADFEGRKPAEDQVETVFAE